MLLPLRSIHQPVLGAIAERFFEPVKFVIFLFIYFLLFCYVYFNTDEGDMKGILISLTRPYMVVSCCFGAILCILTLQILDYVYIFFRVVYFSKTTTKYGWSPQGLICKRMFNNQADNCREFIFCLKIFVT